MSQDPNNPQGDTLPPLNPEYPIPSPPLPGSEPPTNSIHTNAPPFQNTPPDMPPAPPTMQPIPNYLQPIPNYLVWAILETVCCCLPLGVAGLVYALKANSAAQTGRYEEGIKAARTAKTCLIVGLILGIIGNLLNIAIQVAKVASEMPQ